MPQQYRLPLLFGTFALIAFSLFFVTRTSETPVYVLPTLAVLPTDAPAVIASPTGAIEAASPSPQAAAVSIFPTRAPILPTPLPSDDEQAVIPNRKVIQFTSPAAQQDYAVQMQALGAQVTAIDELNTLVIDFPVSMPELPALPAAARSEPDYLVSAQHDLANVVTINDPLANQQWGLNAIAASEAWHHVAADAAPLTLAVIDSGVCAAHPDLVGRVLAGVDYVDGDSDPADSFGHGCAVSGIIAANMNDAFGMAGVAPRTNILPLRVLDANGLGSYSDVAAAIVYAVDNGAKVINLSLGGANPATVLENAVNYAADRSVTVIAAAGNTGQSSALYPAAYPSVIAVGAVDSNLQRSSFSNHGDQIDVYAPGRDILAPEGASGYANFTGTSFAAPHVSGLAALAQLTGGELVINGGLARYGGSVIVVDGGSTPAATYTGILSILYGDPQDTSEDHKGFVYLQTDAGTSYELLMTTYEAFPLRNRRVEVAGSVVANVDPAALTMTTSALEVATVRPLSADDEAAAQVFGTFRWLTLLCEFPNIAVGLPDASVFEPLFANSHPGIDHYWREQSYNKVNLGDSQSQIYGWYTMPLSRNSYVSGAGANLNLIARDCARQANNDGLAAINFQNYDGINFLFDYELDCCAWGGGLGGVLSGSEFDGGVIGQAATWMPPWAQDYAILGHEMGHGFGLAHSSGAYSTAYDSIWDIMSLSRAYYDEDGLFRGPGTIALNRWILDWIDEPGDPSDDYEGPLVDIGESATFTLERLNLPQNNTNPLVIFIPIAGTDQFYTVEARMWDDNQENSAEGYDTYLYGSHPQIIPPGAPLPYFREDPGAVLIHRVNFALSDRWAQVVDPDRDSNPNDESAMWLPGENFRDSAKNICVSVISQQPTSYTVAINNNATNAVVPVLRTPLNEEATTVTRPQFRWEAAAGAPAYVLQLSTSSSFTNIITMPSSLSIPGTSFTATTDLTNGTYYWRVRPTNGTDCKWSDVRRVVVNSSVPFRNYTTDSTPTLTWERVSYAAGYQIQVGRSSVLASPQFTYDIPTPEQLEITTDVLDEGLWYWRVRAKRSDGAFGSWSAIQSLTVDAIPD